MGNYKFPGPDGLHTIFYKTNWDHLGPIVFKCIEEMFEDPSRLGATNFRPYYDSQD